MHVHRYVATHTILSYGLYLHPNMDIILYKLYMHATILCSHTLAASHAARVRPIAFTHETFYFVWTLHYMSESASSIHVPYCITP